jgi:hypothetical protein
MKYNCKVSCNEIWSRSSIIREIKIEERNSKRTRSKTSCSRYIKTRKTRSSRLRKKSYTGLDEGALSTRWFTSDRPRRKVMPNAQLFGRVRKAGSSNLTSSAG